MYILKALEQCTDYTHILLYRILNSHIRNAFKNFEWVKIAYKNTDKYKNTYHSENKFKTL